MRIAWIIAALAAMTAGVAAAQAAPAPPIVPAPARHLPVDKPDPPYPMNYADEAAQSLGIVHGRLDLFSFPSRQHGIVPDVKGGIDRGRPTLKLQWPVN